MTIPLISVIVPVYNVAGHVAACLESIRAQSLTDFEVIVVDDGSTDGSGDIARAAVGDDPRFRFITQENRGLSGARNSGLDVARGAFVAFVDSDDRIAPAYLAHLHAALEETGADWVACAIRSCFPDGGHADHSAIHGAAALDGAGGATRYALTDWRDVIRHFPSAWNKLYRRSLIDGLRYDEGTWFEDHAFYYRAACRTDHILHLPEPLYLQTRGREGQITATDSEQVFEQLSVLDTLWGIMAASDKAHAKDGFERIATRLMFERSTVVRDADRRARFKAACRDFLTRHGIRYAPEWDSDISRAWGMALAGEVPVSVVVPFAGDGALLAETVTSLAGQEMADYELLLVCDNDGAAATARTVLGETGTVLIQPGQGAGPARNHGMAQAQGALVVFLDAGDRLMPWALTHWTAAMFQHGADMGVSQFTMGGAHPHVGFHDMAGLEAPLETGPITLNADQVLALESHPSAKVFRRAFLLEQSLKFGAGPLPEWQLVIRAAVQADTLMYLAGQAVEIAEAPAARAQWLTPTPARDLVAALEALAADLAPVAGHLPPGWKLRLWSRALWEKLSFARFPSRGAKLRFALGMVWAARRRGIARDTGALDPFVGPRLARLLGKR